MQYEQISKDERVDLPRPSIDTGMGLERIAAVLQGTHDNYETDLFRALIQNSMDLTGVDEVGEAKASHRVIADHLRSTCFLIADGVLPSSDGRGYVLRRIMRRAMRHARLLGSQDPIIYKMVPTLVREMGQAFPELVRGRSIDHRDSQARGNPVLVKPLSRGLQLLDEATDGLGKGDSLDGETAFKLYDTYGFPLDLTQDALRARSIAVDVDGFDTAMARQKAEARANWAGSGEAATEAIWFDLSEKVGASEFLGYDRERTEGAVVALVKDGAEVQSLKAGDEACIILNQTPFYGESGGQIGDTGLMLADGVRFEVSDTVKKNHGMFVHMGKLVKGAVKIGDAQELVVDHDRRSAIRANHSATHLLHEALRETLGEHVAQKGSFVTPERLRFDFSHQKPVSPDEMSQIEEMVNEIVLQNGPVETRIMAVDDAIEAGAMALFGEKYGDEVRVVSMGEALRGDKAGKTYSVELCGGTHVSRTGDVGVMTIVSESAVAAGVRRIEALTGKEARAYLQMQDHRVREAAGILKVAPNDLLDRLEVLVADRRKLEKELADVRKKLAMGGSGSGGDAVKEVNGVKFLARVAEGISPKDLKGMVDQGKESIASGVVVMIAVSEDDKVGVVVGVTNDLTDRFNAVDMVKVAAEALGGRGGGGRPDMAQAGGKDAGKADDAIKAIEVMLK